MHVMIRDDSRRVIPFRSLDAKLVGADCFYLDFIVWLNSRNIEMGDRVKFNSGCWVNGQGGIVFDDDASIGPNTSIHSANHRFSDLDRRIIDQGWVDRPVRIGRDAWIGMNCTILPGADIGERAVIGGGSVVYGTIPAFTVAVGNPARVVRRVGDDVRD